MPHASRSDRVSKGRGAAFVFVWIAVAALPSTATALTVFDFDDFPAAGVPTADYGCYGKSFCDEGDTMDARDPQTGLESPLSNTRNGIELVLTDSLSSLVVEGFPGISFLTGIDCGANCTQVQVITGDFSKDLSFAEVDLGTPEFFLSPDGTVEEYAFLEIWSETGATGTLLGRRELLASDAPAEPFVTLGLAAPEGTTFRSIRFGRGFPGCENGCILPYDEGEPLPSFADNIGVQAIPEPGTAVLFAVGMGLARLAIRRQRR